MDKKKETYLSKILEYSKIPPSNISKETFLGILTRTILDKDIFGKNNELKIFLEDLLECEIKDYLIKSRSLVLAHTLKKTDKLDNKNLHNLKAIYFIYFRKKYNIKNNETISKWFK